MCVANNEAGKYLMTFQNLLSRIPKWNTIIVEEERKRIIERSGCNYLEDLITCVHIIQLKVLTCIRVGNKQKKIDISIPKLDHFIHKVYIHAARKIYMNVYLFEKNINPLLMQKNGRELEMIIQECILTTIRDSIPTEAIIRAYMDESIEQEEEVIIEAIEPVKTEDNGQVSQDSSIKTDLDSTPALIDKTLDNTIEAAIPATVPSIQNLDNGPVITRLSFNDYDAVMDEANTIENVNAPKTIERLEEISTSRAIQRKLEEEAEDMNDRIKIHTDNIHLDNLDVFDVNKTNSVDNIGGTIDDLLKLDFETL